MKNTTFRGGLELVVGLLRCLLQAWPPSWLCRCYPLFGRRGHTCPRSTAPFSGSAPRTPGRTSPEQRTYEVPLPKPMPAQTVLCGEMQASPPASLSLPFQAHGKFCRDGRIQKCRTASLDIAWFIIAYRPFFWPFCKSRVRRSSTQSTVPRCSYHALGRRFLRYTVERCSVH